MKRVLLLVVALTLLGGGIAFAIAATGSTPAVVQTRVESETTTTSLVQALNTATPTPSVEATPVETATPEATEEPEAQPAPQTFADDSSSDSDSIVAQPFAAPQIAQTSQADLLAQNALTALKQLLDSPQSHDIDALTGAIKALDGAIAQINTLGLPVEQQQSEVAVLLLARAHLIELITQVAKQNAAQPKATPSRSSSSNRGSFFLSGSRRDLPDVVSGFRSAPVQP